MKIRFFSFCIFLAAATLNLSAQSGSDDQAVQEVFTDSDVAWNNHNAQQLTNPQNATGDADFINVYGGWTKG